MPSGPGSARRADLQLGTRLESARPPSRPAAAGIATHAGCRSLMSIRAPPSSASVTRSSGCCSTPGSSMRSVRRCCAAGSSTPARVPGPCPHPCARTPPACHPLLRGLRRPSAARDAAHRRGPSVTSPPGDRPCSPTWAALLSRVYELSPLVRPRCGGELRIVALIRNREVIDRILGHLHRTGRDPRLPPLMVVPPFSSTRSCRSGWNRRQISTLPGASPGLESARVPRCRRHVALFSFGDSSPDSSARSASQRDGVSIPRVLHLLLD